jgi:hypothetical protein
MALASIGHDLAGLSGKIGLTSDLQLLESAWNRELGRLHEFARITAIDHASLVVEVDTSVVMQEISLRRRELVRKLNQHLPAPVLRQITLRISQHYGR